MTPPNDRKERYAVELALAEAEATIARLRLQIQSVCDCTDRRCSLCARCCQAVGLLPDPR